VIIQENTTLDDLPRSFALRVALMMAARYLRLMYISITAILLLCINLHAQTPGAVVPGRFLVLYKDAVIPTATATLPGTRLIHTSSHLGIQVVDTLATTPTAITASQDALTRARLLALPNVAAVVQDRIVKASQIETQAIPNQERYPVRNPTLPGSIFVAPALPILADTFYTASPQDWAVKQVGGYGLNVPGSPTPTGPWNLTTGKGVRIAILDSGLDAHHPDLSPNLALNLSEIDQSALPSACDDGSPQDQQGHGTFVASLAAAAMGPGTGLMVGVAPSATLLNIKVLERLPGTGATLTAQCAAGQASGLLSWVVQGIDDAIANHANIISMSLGTIVDTYTGDGAGLVATFNQVTHAAANANIILIAAAGNDAFNFANTQYVELPAQSRDVLAIVASTNPACAENLAANATCASGPITLPYYSNYGAPLNALAAPGGSYPAGSDSEVSGWVRGACSAGLPNTISGPPTTPGQSFGCFNLGQTQYVQAIGTSASAPLAAGAAALYLAAHPTWTAAQVVAALRTTATTIATLPAPQITAAALQP
jgi:subtilisin family serine protease